MLDCCHSGAEYDNNMLIYGEKAALTCSCVLNSVTEESDTEKTVLHILFPVLMGRFAVLINRCEVLMVRLEVLNSRCGVLTIRFAVLQIRSVVLMVHILVLMVRIVMLTVHFLVLMVRISMLMHRFLPGGPAFFPEERIHFTLTPKCHEWI